MRVTGQMNRGVVTLLVLLGASVGPCGNCHAEVPGKERLYERLQALRAELQHGSDPWVIKGKLLALKSSVGGLSPADADVAALLEGITDTLNLAQEGVAGRAAPEVRNKLTVLPSLRRHAAALTPAYSFGKLSTREEYDTNRKALRQQLERLLGGLPARTALNPVVLERQEFEGYTREKVSFESEPGRSVIGYLLVPKDRKGPLPAIVCFHQHGREYFAGKDGPVGNGTTDPALRYALDLARRGYVTLTIDAPCFGERIEDEGEAGYLAALVGRPLIGFVIYDDIRSIDYLLTRSEVDKDRIGCIGHSLGGTRAIFVSALDERVKVAISLNAFSSIRDLIAENLYLWPATASLPGLLPYADLEDLVSMAAPRPYLLAVSEFDRSLPLGNVEAGIARVRRVYAAYEAERSFGFVVFRNAAHEFPEAYHDEIYSWFDRHLGR